MSDFRKVETGTRIWVLPPIDRLQETPLPVSAPLYFEYFNLVHCLVVFTIDHPKRGKSLCTAAEGDVCLSYEEFLKKMDERLLVLLDENSRDREVLEKNLEELESLMVAAADD